MAARVRFGRGPEWTLRLLGPICHAADRREAYVKRGKPKVFIGSSKEGKKVARKFAKALETDNKVKLWTEAFVPGGTTLATLMQQAAQADFAVIVLTPDDELVSRGESWHVPRDNLVFEAGLFMGTVGPERTLLAHPAKKKPKLPSDLDSFTTAPYRGENVGEAISRIEASISRLGRRGYARADLLVEVPDDTPAKGLEVRVAGTLDRVSDKFPHWEPGAKMKLRRDGRWRLRLEAPDGTGIEYKYLLGPPWDWSREERYANGEWRPNRELVFRTGEKLKQEDFVQAWLRPDQ